MSGPALSGFDVTVRTSLSPLRAWDAVTRWPAHGDHVPLTRVYVRQDVGGLGDVFVGRTGVGRLGFDDPMRVTRWDPPGTDGIGVCEVTKLGRVVSGGATIEVRPDGGRTSVRWVEQVGIGPAWLTRLGGPLIRFGGGLVFARTLRRILADTERA